MLVYEVYFLKINITSFYDKSCKGKSQIPVCYKMSLVAIKNHCWSHCGSLWSLDYSDDLIGLHTSDQILQFAILFLSFEMFRPQ